MTPGIEPQRVLASPKPRKTHRSFRRIDLREANRSSKGRRPAPNNRSPCRRKYHPLCRAQRCALLLPSFRLGTSVETNRVLGAAAFHVEDRKLVNATALVRVEVVLPW